ncbi:MAG: signal recognition particle-docking protein FtsY [Clostridia bacterium]|nr:signal recognition particle-docking protein FtsY [Clostridia bacterium]
MGFFSKIINGLKKTKNTIADKLSKLFGLGISDEFYEELENILISADVGAACSLRIVDELRDKVSEKRLKTEEEVRAALKEIMVETLTYDPFDPDYPLVILVVGVNGVGKTTSIGKLASWFVSKKKSVVLAAADTFRAAASEQLGVWADRANVRIVKHAEGADPSAVVYDAISSAKAKKTDVVIVDTAGRLHNKTNLMQELSKINRVIDREYPEAVRYNFLVLDATTGQNAIQQVNAFDQSVELDGLILTKLDGTAKGGVVLAINEETEVPVYFVGVGEGIDDLMEFDAESFVDGIL